MTPEQQAIINILTFLAAAVTVLGTVVVNFYRVRTNVHVEATKAQVEATKAQAVEIPNLASQMTQISLDTAATLKQVIDNQRLNALNTKQLIDGREPLESLVKQNFESLTQFRDVVTTFQQTLISAMREMRGAQGAIIAAVNDHSDQNVAGMSAMLNGLNATASGNATRLTTLDQKVSEHKAMTEKELKELGDELAGIPEKVASLTAAQTETVVRAALTKLASLEAEVETLRPEKVRADALEAENTRLREENAQLKAGQPKPGGAAV